MPGNRRLTRGAMLPMALAASRLIDADEFVAHRRLAGHGPCLLDGLSKGDESAGNVDGAHVARVPLAWKQHEAARPRHVHTRRRYADRALRQSFSWQGITAVRFCRCATKLGGHLAQASLFAGGVGRHRAPAGLLVAASLWSRSGVATDRVQQDQRRSREKPLPVQHQDLIRRLHAASRDGQEPQVVCMPTPRRLARADWWEEVPPSLSGREGQ